MTIRKQLEQDARQHPNTWCLRNGLPGTRVRFIPERQVMQIEASGTQQAITGETVILDYPIVMEFSAR